MVTLTHWWMRLEASARLGGPRRHLQDRLGPDVVGFLERVGILRERGIAPTFPCTKRPGNLCPRTVVGIDDAYHVVCGDGPSGCPDLVLNSDDVALLSVDILRMARTISRALGVPGVPQDLPDLKSVYRLGSIVPQPGIRHPVFLAIRSSGSCYAEVLGALAARQAGRPFAVLVPTARFITDGLEDRVRSWRAVLIVLADVLEIEAGHMMTRADPQRLFSSLGAGSVPAAGMHPASVARAIVRDRGHGLQWLDLDDAAYRDLLVATDRYDVLADERQRRVWKGTTVTTGVSPSYFRTLQAALNARGYFDPNASSLGLTSSKQIFQRARQTFDPGSARSSWKLFKTVRTEEKHVVYAFNPDPDVSFAFIFVPDT